MRLEFKNYLPVALTFQKLLYPFAEVVIHDLEKDQIAAIYNSFSEREIGDGSYLDRMDFTVDHDEYVIGPYDKINFDGKKLKSISLIIRDTAQKPIGLLCVNMDITVFENYSDTIQSFLKNNDKDLAQSKETLFKDALYEQINMFIKNYCTEHQLNIHYLNRNDKKSLIRELKAQGAFKSKNATNYIARILKISRATVYNYIE